MNGDIKRHTAYKISIGLIGKGELKLEPDKNDPTRERFRFLSLQNKDINRVNIIANVIDKFSSDEKNYSTLTIDDGTGQMRVRAFSDNAKMLENLQPGDTILVIGTLRYFNKEVYILPELTKTLDSKWLLARKLELEKEYGELYKNLEKTIPKTEPEPLSQPTSEPLKKPILKEPTIERPNIEEEKIETEKESENKEPNLREKIIKIIKAAEPEEGIDVDKIIMKLNSYAVEEINNTVMALLEEGTIYEPKPGRLRIL